MASDLDKRLRALLIDGGIEDEPDVKTDDYVELIKQAFKDAGWVDTNAIGLQGFTVNNIMTGQAWYDRFSHELQSSNSDLVCDDGTLATWADFYLKAAKRASGLE